MNEVISRIITFKTDKLPPTVESIENEIIKNKIEPLRWAIVEIVDNEITLSVSGRVLK